MKMYLLFQMLLGFQLTALKLTFILAEWRFFLSFSRNWHFWPLQKRKPISKVIPVFQKLKRTLECSKLVLVAVWLYICISRISGSMYKRNVYDSLTS